jgi:fluoride exporter
MDLIYVGIGGALGSLARFQLGKMVSDRTKTKFPLGTFIINISGAFFLGIVSSLNVDKNGYLLLGEGFLGAYTTFSTFMYEGFKLFGDNKKVNAALYIVCSLLIGIAGYIAGVQLGYAVKFFR